MDKYPDVFGTTFILDKRESYCVVGEFVHRVGLVNRNTGKIDPEQFNRITKSMYWFYLYSLWVDNESISPMDQIKDRQSFPNDMNKMLYKFFRRRYKTLLMDEESISKFLDTDKKVMKLAYREHILAFVNHIVAKLSKSPDFVLKIRASPLPTPSATATGNLSIRNRSHIATELHTKGLDAVLRKQDEKATKLIDSIIEDNAKPKPPTIKIHKEVEVITNGAENMSSDAEPIVVRVEAKLRAKKPKAVQQASTLST